MTCQPVSTYLSQRNFPKSNIINKCRKSILKIINIGMMGVILAENFKWLDTLCFPSADVFATNASVDQNCYHQGKPLPQYRGKSGRI
jgi:hypothetical protein